MLVLLEYQRGREFSKDQRYWGHFVKDVPWVEKQNYWSKIIFTTHSHVAICVFAVKYQLFYGTSPSFQHYPTIVGLPQPVTWSNLYHPLFYPWSLIRRWREGGMGGGMEDIRRTRSALLRSARQNWTTRRCQVLWSTCLSASFCLSYHRRWIIQCYVIIILTHWHFRNLNYRAKTSNTHM